ncbi:hypothetical protein Tco_1402859 [Tanacetum coccineum]
MEKVWNDPRDFAKPVKAIALPQDVPSTSDHHLIELENQVQRLMEAHLALAVGDVPSASDRRLIELKNQVQRLIGPHDTQYCMKNPEQASVDYTSSRIKEVGGKRFTPNHRPRNFNDAGNTWKEKPNFNWAHTQTFTSPQGGSISFHSSSYQMKLEKALLDFDSNQEKKLSHLRTQLEQQQDDMIGKINFLWKNVSEKINSLSTHENAGNPTASKSITAISHDKREELRKKGIKSPSKFLSLKYISLASIKELNKNPSAPKRVHFVNSIVIRSTNSDTKEDDDSSTNACDLNLGSMVKGKEEVKEQGKEENEMETDMEVEEEIDEEGSKFETDEEVEEIIKEEEDDKDGENFNSRQYNQIMTYGLRTRQKPSNPNKIRNFVGRIRGLKIFIGSFAYECDFMILEDTTSIIDHHLGEMVFGRLFIKETSLVYNEEEGAVMFKQDDEKIIFKIPHTMKIFKQARLIGLSTDSIPPSAYEENFGHGRMHYYQSLLIGDEYKQDDGDRKGIRHLMRLEKEMMDNKGEVT